MDIEAKSSPEDRVMAMTIKQLKDLLVQHGQSLKGITEKSELQKLALEIVKQESSSSLQSAPSQMTPSSSENMEVPTDSSPYGNFFRELNSTPSNRIGSFLAENLTRLSGGLRLSDIPPLPSKVCGKIFQEGDLAYNCRTCESDSTCVQCQECFLKSKHEGHDIFFHQAGPGGCCDCGDLEAWAAEGCCSNHGPNAPSNSEDDPTSFIPEKMLEATGILFKGCVSLIQQVVWDDVKTFHSAIVESKVVPGSEQDMRDDYHVLMHNDDIHTFDEVTTVLRHHQAQVDDPNEATDMIDKLGRCSIFRASKLSDAQVAVERFRSSGLIMSIAPTRLLEREKMVIAVLHWLKKTCEAVPGLIRVLLNEMMQPDKTDTRLLFQQVFRSMLRWNGTLDRSGEISFLETLIKIHYLTPKLFIKQLTELFMRCVVDERFKLELGVAMGKSINVLAQLYAHGVGVSTYTLLDLNVQLFTVQSIAVEYSKRFGDFSLAYDIVLACASFLDVTSDGQQKLDFKHRSLIHKRYAQFFQNLRWQFQLHLYDDIPSEDLQIIFQAFVERVLAKFSGMNPQKRRQQLDHVLFEDNTYQFSFTLHFIISTVMTKAVELLESLRRNRSAAKQILIDTVTRSAQIDGDYEPRLSKGEVSFSFHQLLHHFAGTLCRRMAVSNAFVVDELESGMAIESDPSGFFGTVIQDPQTFMEPSLRTVSACAQIVVGMMRRDGFAVTQQMFHYTRIQRSLLFDLDLFVIQSAWSAMIAQDGLEQGTSGFLYCLLRKFELDGWLKATEAKIADPDGHLVGLWSEVLRLLINLVSGLPSVNAIDRLNVARRAIVNHLSVAQPGKTDFASLVDDLEGDGLLRDDGDSSADKLTEKEIVDLLPSCAKVIETPDGETKFDVRPELLLTEFDPFYWHLDRVDLDPAVERREKFLAKEKPTSRVSLAPRPHSVIPEYFPIIRSLCSDVMLLEIIRPALSDAVLGNSILWEKTVMASRDELAVSSADATSSTTEESPLPRIKWEKDALIASATRTSASTLRAALHLLTLVLYRPELVNGQALTKAPTSLSFSIAESIIALRSVTASPNDAEAHGLDWIIEQMWTNFASSNGRLSRLITEFRKEQQDKADQDVSVEKSGKKKGSRKRSMGAQQAIMERMRRAQQAAIKSFLPEGETMDVEQDQTGLEEGPSKRKPDPGASLDEDMDREDVLADEWMICALCREQGDPDDLGFFAFVETSTWDRSDNQKPVILGGTTEKPAGWFPSSNNNDALDTSAASVHSSTAAEQGVESFDWGMTDVLDGSGEEEPQGPFDDEDDDDEEGEEEEEDDENLQTDLGGGEEEEEEMLVHLPDGTVFDGTNLMADFVSSITQSIIQNAQQNSANDRLGDVPISLPGNAGPPQLLALGKAVDMYTLRSSHGISPGRPFVHCCPHAVHMKCYQQYRQSAQTDNSEMNQLSETQCSVCKLPSKCVLLAGSNQAVKSSAPEELVSDSWSVDWSTLNQQPQPLAEQPQFLKVWNPRWHLGMLSGLQGIALSWTIPVDTQLRTDASRKLESFVGDSIRTRRESLTVFRALGQVALSHLGSVQNSAEVWQEFLLAGSSVASNLARVLTSAAANTMHLSSDKTIIRTPSDEFAKFGLMRPIHIGNLCTTDAHQYLVHYDPAFTKQQAIAMEWNGESVNGKRVEELRKSGEECQFQRARSLRRAFLIDCDPFEVFCATAGSLMDVLDEKMLFAITKLSVALAMVRCVLRMPKNTSPAKADDSHEVSLVESMVRKAQGQPAFPMSSREMKQELAPLLLQLANAHAIFLGRRWVRNLPVEALNASVDDTDALWGALRLPQPAPYCSTTAFPTLDERSSASLASFESLLQPWVSALSSFKKSPAPYRSLTPQPLAFHFVDLPQRYDTLYNMVMTKATCPSRNGAPPKEPALCLLCGEVVCAGATCCKRTISHESEERTFGAATLHTLAMGSMQSVGVFLLVQRAQCLLLYGGRAISVPAPYVDAHGNPDPFLRKGRPLSLSTEKYEAIQRQIAEHKLGIQVVRTRNSSWEVIRFNYF